MNMKKQLLALWLVYILAGITPSWAAITAATAWEVRPTVGSATNGAGFSIKVGSATSLTDVAIDSVLSTKISSSSHGTFAADVMKYGCFTAGTGFTVGCYQILTLQLFSATYTSGGTITGTNGQTCTLSSFNGGGSGATATVALTGTNTIAGGTALTITNSGTGFTSAITSATLGSGSATCSGTATLSSVMAAVLDRSVGTVSSTSGSFSLYPGIDRSQQTSAQVVIDGTVITATCNTNTITFTGGTYNPGTVHADDGNLVHLASGQTNVTAGWYEITNSTSTTWVISGAAQACTAATNTLASASNEMGGAADIPDSIFGAISGGNTIFVKASGTWTSAGINSVTATTVTNAGGYSQLIGYTSSRSDGGMVTVQPTTTGLTALTLSGAGWRIRNFTFDGSGTNTWGGCISDTGGVSIFSNIKCNNFTGIGVKLAAGTLTLQDSEVTAGQSGCTEAVDVTANDNVIGNNILSNLCPGVIASAVSALIYNNLISGNSTEGMLFDVGNVIISNTFDTDVIGLVGTASSSAKGAVVLNNLFSNNTTAGYEPWTTVGYPATFATDGNCYYNNGTNILNSSDEGNATANNGEYPYRNTKDQILGASPYNSGKFSLVPSSAAVQGGQPSAMLGRTETSLPSCGAFQPSSAGGGAAFVQ